MQVLALSAFFFFKQISRLSQLPPTPQNHFADIEFSSDDLIQEH